MKSFEKKDWAVDFGPDLSSERMKSQYFPAGKFRVSESVYSEETSFAGAMRSGLCFVLEGSCTYLFDVGHVILETGDYAKLPEGRYQFVASGSGIVRLILVWELPF